MLNFAISMLLICLLGMTQATPVKAESIALLVGIKDYDRPDMFPILHNAERDVLAIKRGLEAQKFKVHTLLSSQPHQTGHDDILDKWAEIVGSSKDGDVVLFYFAGHAIELRGRNYLQPKDANARGRSADDVGDITTSSIDFHDLLDKLAHYQEHKRIHGIFVLDACRENPIKDQFPDAADLRTVGLVSVPKLPHDVFVLYSAGIGQNAWDGEPGTNSPFAAEFVDLLENIELDPKLANWSWTRIAERMRVGVRNRVASSMRSPGGGVRKPLEQVPAYYSQFRVGRLFDGRPATNRFVAYQNDRFSVDVTALEAGDSFAECPFCPVMVIVPPATGTDGSRNRRYAIGKFEVTQREWNRCAKEGTCSTQMFADFFGVRSPSLDDHPVTNVDWNEARTFITWLSKKTGATYRLPTEVEWLHAARAGASTAFVFGDEMKDERLCQFANGADRENGILASQYNHCSDNVGRGTSRVGAFRANSFGLHDVHGNVWEWLATCWPGEAPKNQVNGAAAMKQDCNLRVARGGSWASGAEAMSFAVANRFPVHHSRKTLGFRVVREID